MTQWHHPSPSRPFFAISPRHAHHTNHTFTLHECEVARWLVHQSIPLAHQRSGNRNVTNRAALRRSQSSNGHFFETAITSRPARMLLCPGKSRFSISPQVQPRSKPAHGRRISREERLICRRSHPGVMSQLSTFVVETGIVHCYANHHQYDLNSPFRAEEQVMDLPIVPNRSTSWSPLESALDDNLRPIHFVEILQDCTILSLLSRPMILTVMALFTYNAFRPIAGLL